jgi:LPS-assembly lipoprotein
MAPVMAMALTLTACFRPLYGPTASGEPLESVLSAIDVAEVTAPSVYDRVGHYLRNELIFDLNGSGVPHAKRYKLVLSYSQSIQTPIVESTTGRAESATIVGRVSYTLKTLDGKTTVADGTATGYVSYDRSPQRFATVRAARDADIRIAKVLSEQIKTRLAAALATAS